MGHGEETQRPPRLDDTVLCSGTLGSIPFPEKIEVASRRRLLRDSRSITVSPTSPSGFGGRLPMPACFWRNWTARAPGCRIGRSRGPTGSGIRRSRFRPWRTRSLTIIEVTGVTPPLDVAVAAFADVCDLAAQAGVLVHLEPFPWSGIRDFGIRRGYRRRRGPRPTVACYWTPGICFAAPIAELSPMDSIRRWCWACKSTAYEHDPQRQPSVRGNARPVASRRRSGSRADSYAARELRAGGCLAPLGSRSSRTSWRHFHLQR